MAIAIPLALGVTGCASKGGTQGAEASNGRLPSFKTASIKLNNAPRAVEIYTFSKDRFVATESAMHMIIFAYGEKHPLKPAQVLGGPEWMRTEVFDIETKLPKSLWDQFNRPLHTVEPPPRYLAVTENPAEIRRTDTVKQIFRSLLINRFKLRIRHETQDLPVYELVSANNNAKITKDKTDDRPCGIAGPGPAKGLGMDVKSCDFRTFVRLLSGVPELRSRVLVDKTGLHGRYSFKLHWTLERPPGMPIPARGGQRNQGAEPSEPSGPSLFRALREQLGLRVVSGKAPVDVIVIEHIERPTPN